MTTLHPKVPPGRAIDPEILKRLGAVIVGWSTVEALLAEFLTFLVKADTGAMYIVNQSVPIATQLKWVRTLARDMFTNPDTREGLHKLFNRIQETGDERNSYVHGLWSVGPEPGTAGIQTVKLDRAEIVRSTLVTPPDLDDLISDIEEIAAELHQIGVALKFLP